MAAKRDFLGDEYLPAKKRVKSRPSFASVIREVVMVNFFEDFCSALTPMLRRVVSEEVENGVRGQCMRSIVRSSVSSPVLQLRFGEKLSLPIFTGTKIADVHNNPLQIFLVNNQLGSNFPIKIELVVVDGDFPNNNGNTWTADDFNKSIVKERSGKRPLLSGGNQFLTMWDDGVACINRDVELTDNSSWVRSRKFRLGARVVGQHDGGGGGGVVIREAITEPFVVKDHRGELYKKHHPPALEDRVWRLEKIGKGGVFHQKLASHSINTVQDFLKLFVVDSSKLRKILGVGMSEKMWEATLKHAKTCVMGTKLYTTHVNNYTLTFNPICQLVKAEFNGQIYYESDLKLMQTVYIKSLLKDAYANWSSMEELDGPVHENALLTQGDQVVGQQQQQLAVVDSNYMMSDDAVEGVYSDDWPLNFYLATNTSTCASNKSSSGNIRFFSESSSDGDY